LWISISVIESYTFSTSSSAQFEGRELNWVFESGKSGSSIFDLEKELEEK
jgi:hypothetical protein